MKILFIETIPWMYAKVSSIDITPDVLAEDYQSLTINGNKVATLDTYKAKLESGKNLFSIVVTAADNTTRTYTLTITRGN